MMRLNVYLILGLLLLMSAYAQYYDTGELNNATDIYKQAKALNNLTDKMFGLGTVLMLAVITFVIVNANTGNNALSGVIAGSFIATVSSMFLWALQLLDSTVFTVSVVALGLSMFVGTLSRG